VKLANSEHQHRVDWQPPRTSASRPAGSQRRPTHTILDWTSLHLKIYKDTYYIDATKHCLHVRQLSKMYPDMEMKLQVYASEAPEVHFNPGAVKTNLLGAVKAFAIQADGTPIPLFKLNVVGALWFDKVKA